MGTKKYHLVYKEFQVQTRTPPSNKMKLINVITMALANMAHGLEAEVLENNVQTPIPDTQTPIPDNQTPVPNNQTPIPTDQTPIGDDIQVPQVANQTAQTPDQTPIAD